jgi:hypothetical protein
MKHLNSILKGKAISTFMLRMIALVIVLSALESASFNADAQRRGGFGHGGYTHSGFGHAGYGYGGHYYGGAFAINRSVPYWHYSFFPRWGDYYWSLPSASFAFLFGGLNYYLCDGIYYQYYNKRYIVVPAPIGHRVKVLPRGYMAFTFGGLPYFYYYGTFYAPIKGQYEVVQPPVGAIVESIPNGYEKVEVDGQTYYILDGVQYKAILKNNEVWYQVVKNKNNPDKPAPDLQPQNVAPNDSIR